MNRYSVVLTVLILSMLSAGNCLGDVANLRYKIGYQVEDGSLYKQIVVAAQDGAGKGFDGEGVWESLPSSGILLGIRRVEGSNDWDGNTGWYTGDSREMLSPGQSITIDGIYVWAVPGTPNQDMHLYLDSRGLYLDPGVSFSLSLMSVPQGVDYTGRPTIWGPETSEVVLPFYSTNNGETGYRFQLNVSAVPEPSAFLALLGGLGSIGGFALKRRRA